MIVVDTSAWIEHLRATGSSTHLTLRGLLQAQADLAVTEIVIMELLAAARSDEQAIRLRSMLLGFPMTDCLIAVSTISAGASLLARDADFDTLAAHTPLTLQPTVESTEPH